jgi:hypothetical protein
MQRREQTTGQTYRFGEWAPTQPLSDEQWGGARARGRWTRAVDEIPEPVRAAMTHIVRGNLLSENPLPMWFDVDVGSDHGIRVGYGEDTTVTPAVPRIHVTMVCIRPAEPIADA